MGTEKNGKINENELQKLETKILAIIDEIGRRNANYQEIMTNLPYNTKSGDVTNAVNFLEKKGIVRLSYNGIMLTDPREKIYVASSWKNKIQPEVVKELNAIGYDVYDFKAKNHIFAWSFYKEPYKKWSQGIFDPYYWTAMADSRVHSCYSRDMKALNDCDICVLLCPCGRSAHLEAGYAKGSGKKLYIVISKEEFVPELMYKMADIIFENLPSLYTILIERRKIIFKNIPE